MLTDFIAMTVFAAISFLPWSPSQGKQDFEDVSTPLSIEHYLKVPRGGAVGLEPTPERYAGDPKLLEQLDIVTVQRLPGVWSLVPGPCTSAHVSSPPSYSWSRGREHLAVWQCAGCAPNFSFLLQMSPTCTNASVFGVHHDQCVPDLDFVLIPAFLHSCTVCDCVAVRVQPIKNLYMTGQDTLICGVVLAQASGVMTAFRMMGFVNMCKLMLRNIIHGG